MAKSMVFKKNVVHDSIINIDQSDSREPKDPPQLYAFPELTSIIVGRDIDIDNLFELINSNKKILITGLGGLGKTTLAILCAKTWTKQQKFKYSIFVNMELENSANAVYHGLAEHIFNKKTYNQHTITEIYEYYNKTNALFIFDNVTEQTDISKYLPSKDLTNIFILGTSQNRELKNLFYIYEIRTLSEESSVNLVEQIFQKVGPENDQITSELAGVINNFVKVLENHPLALQNAAAFIVDKLSYVGMTILESIEEYVNELEEQLKQTPSQGHLINRSVYTCLKMNIQKAITNKDIRMLLFCMVYLDPMHISIDMFYNYQNLDKNRILEAIRTLKKYSIITEMNSNVISMHRLIPIVCHDLIKEYNEQDYIVILLHIFFSYEDYKFNVNGSLQNHFYLFTQHLKMDRETLATLYIDTFRKNNKMMDHLSKRLKIINCNISDIEDWSILHYCVFAGHRTLFNYFNETIRHETTPWTLYPVRIIKDSNLHVFHNEKSLIDCLNSKLIYKIQINKRTNTGHTLFHLCAAYDTDTYDNILGDYFDLGICRDKLNELTKMGCDINKPDKNGTTPILSAARNRDYNLMFTLHRKGAKYDTRYKKLISAASNEDHESVLSLLRRNEINYAASDFGKALLWWAAAMNYYHITMELIQRGADVIGTDGRNGNTLLHFFAHYGQRELTTKLINQGANINAENSNGYTPLLLATRYIGFGHHVLAAELISLGADVNAATYNGGYTPLFFAAKYGHRELAAEIIRQGANINATTTDGTTPLMIAIKCGQGDVAVELIRQGVNVDDVDYDRHSLLWLAVRHGNQDVTAELIRHGANVNEKFRDEYTPLTIAVRFNHFDLAVELINNGANINKACWGGITPLILAAGNSDQDLAMELVKLGAEINAIDCIGDTPLLLSTRRGHQDLSKELISRGANVNLANDKGDTPLLSTINRGHLELARVLISHNAHVNAANSDGDTPLSLATKYGYPDLAKELISRGADVNTPNKYDKMKNNDPDFCEEDCSIM